MCVKSGELRATDGTNSLLNTLAIEYGKANDGAARSLAADFAFLMNERTNTAIDEQADKTRLFKFIISGAQAPKLPAAHING